ncbi:glycosyltransferase [Microbacterium aurum]
MTQGTIANADLSQLIGPTLEALAGDDVLVVASLGGRVGGALGPVPANARTAAYLPYDRLLPLTDVVVTNGGYGGVQQALAQGMPLVVAGKTEDKVEVAARVGWSGAGIDLRTNTPSAAGVRGAVRQVLSDGRYRRQARELAGAYAQASALEGLDGVLERTLDAAAARSSSIR